jgi:dUTP pyrophosphatase
MSIVVVLELERLESAQDLPVPRYQTAGAAGVDLHAAVRPDLVLAPLERCLVPTGVRIAIPDGFEGQVRPRSGLALRHGVTVLNSPGTIDSDFRGEVQVLLVNLGQQPFTVERGARIAQLLIAPVARAQVCEVRVLPPTERGTNGFGSTGLART